MRRIPLRLVFAVLAAVFTASCATPADGPGFPPRARTVQVRPRPGVTYRTLTSGGTVAVLNLVRCSQPASDEHGHGSVGAGSRTARDRVGDVLEIPPGGAPVGTQINITRKRAASHRFVEASADSAVSSARLSIDLSGCAPATGITAVYWDGSGWTDMGGTVAGSLLTVDLPHLSIYAVAGN